MFWARGIIWFNRRQNSFKFLKILKIQTPLATVPKGVGYHFLNPAPMIIGCLIRRFCSPMALSQPIRVPGLSLFRLAVNSAGKLWPRPTQRQASTATGLPVDRVSVHRTPWDSSYYTVLGKSRIVTVWIQTISSPFCGSRVGTWRATS